MRVIRPITVTDAMLTSSNVTDSGTSAYNPATSYAAGNSVHVASGTLLTIYESLQSANTGHAPASSPLWWRAISTTYAAYAGGTTYAAEDRVLDTTNHWIFESAAGGNVGNALPAPGEDNEHWLSVGPSNRWAIFDQSSGTLTTRTGSIEAQITPGTSVNALGVVETDAESVTVTVTVGGTPIYSETKSTYAAGSAPAGWYAWLFSGRERKTTLTFWDMPTNAAAVITVEINAIDDATETSAGTVTLGRALTIGSTEAGPQVEFVDYSRTTENEFGRTSVDQRSYANRVPMRALIETRLAKTIQKALAPYRSIPMLWEGSEDFEILTLYGFYKNLSFNLALENISYVSVTVQSLSQD